MTSRVFIAMASSLLILFLPVLQGCRKEDRPVDSARGERIFGDLSKRICGELRLCWKFVGYDDVGEKVFSEIKTPAGPWGPNDDEEEVLLVPSAEWGKLTEDQKQELEKYLRKTRISKVVIGRVGPVRLGDASPHPTIKTVFLDETVWRADSDR